MMKKEKLEIIDISGKKTVDCPYCGFTLQVLPRTIGMETLRHMQYTAKDIAWRKKNAPDLHVIAHVRMLPCSKCGKPIICKDEFSSEQ